MDNINHDEFFHLINKKIKKKSDYEKINTLAPCVNINHCDQHYNSALSLSIMQDDEKLLNILIDNNVDLNKLHVIKQNALLLAISNKATKCLHLLMQIPDKLNLNATDSYGTGAVNIAIKTGNVTTLTQLLNFTHPDKSPIFNVNELTDDKNSALQNALWHNAPLAMIYLLIKHNCDVNYQNNNGNALIYSIFGNNNQAFEYLLDNNINTHLLNNKYKQNTLLHWIVQRENTYALNLLLNTHKDLVNPNISNENNQTPLMMAINQRHPLLCNLLLQFPHDLNHTDIDNNNYLHYAIKANMRDDFMIQLLEANPSLLIQKNSSNLTPVELMHKLIEQKKSLDFDSYIIDTYFEQYQLKNTLNESNNPNKKIKL